MPQPHNHKSSKDKKKKNPNQILRYSGLGMQLAISIFVGAMIGKKLDAYYETSQPLFTAFLALLFMGVSMYAVLKDLIKK